MKITLESPLDDGDDRDKDPDYVPHLDHGHVDESEAEPEPDYEIIENPDSDTDDDQYVNPYLLGSSQAKRLSKAKTKKDHDTKPRTRQAKNHEVVDVTETSDSEIEDLVSYVYVADKRKNTSTSSKNTSTSRSGENSDSPPQPLGTPAHGTAYRSTISGPLQSPSRSYSRAKKSLIWNHVEKGINRIHCKYCDRFWEKQERQGSTSSLRKHIIVKHWEWLSIEERNSVGRNTEARGNMPR